MSLLLIAEKCSSILHVLELLRLAEASFECRPSKRQLGRLLQEQFAEAFTQLQDARIVVIWHMRIIKLANFRNPRVPVQRQINVEHVSC